MMFNALFFLLLTSISVNILLVVLAKSFSNQLKEFRNKPVQLESLDPVVIIDGDEHVHLWGKWEDSTVLRYFSDGSVKNINTQKRYCTMCNFKESVQVHSR